jgi:hypothetical protein
MEPRRPPRAIMLVLAAIFLFEAWVWQLCVALGRRIAALIPWERLKLRVKAFIGRLPAPAALAIFLIPVAIIEPFKVVSLALIADGHWVLGVLGFVALKFVGFGLIAIVFDLTREKLLTMPWFVRVYEVFLWVETWAHRLIAPYKQMVVAQMRSLRAWARGYLASFARG